jgi:type I restriction enzyme S subunit
MYALRSQIAYRQAVACATGTGQKTVPLTGLRRLQIPIPPLAEQKHITAKLDEMMLASNELTMALLSTAASRERLFAALLHEALTGIV